jgi:Domain of unknown function (DUF4232)
MEGDGYVRKCFPYRGSASSSEPRASEFGNEAPATGSMAQTLADPEHGANVFVRFLYDCAVRLPLISRIVLAGVVAAGLAGCGTKTVTVTQTVVTTVTKTVTKPPPPPSAAAACQGTDVGGSFAAVPGSAGAGQITYRLTLKNTSASSCFVSGLPQLQLLDAAGKQLPTAVSAAQTGQATAAKIVLVPGASASSDARFSPDVPGTGDVAKPNEPCEPIASQLQVTLGGGSLTVPIAPPTSVCERGSLRMSSYAAA